MCCGVEDAGVFKRLWQGRGLQVCCPSCLPVLCAFNITTAVVVSLPTNPVITRRTQHPPCPPLLPPPNNTTLTTQAPQHAFPQGGGAVPQRHPSPARAARPGRIVPAGRDSGLCGGACCSWCISLVGLLIRRGQGGRRGGWRGRSCHHAHRVRRWV